MTALLTLAEAAEVLRVSERTVYRLHQRRRLPYVRIGGQIQYRVLTERVSVPSDDMPGTHVFLLWSFEHGDYQFCGCKFSHDLILNFHMT